MSLPMPVPHRGLMKRVLGAAWHLLPPHPLVPGDAFERADGLKVIVSARIERDAKTWLHVSCSRRDRLPSWEDLRDVRESFVPDDKVALQVLPPPEEYVNLHPHVLHLWACHDARPTPDFRDGGLV
jgi:hypothetical protein